MGLEIVELVMAYEQVFEIQIPDEKATELVTVGDMYDFIVQATRSYSPAPDPDAIWKKMVEITAWQLSIKVGLINKESNYVSDLGCG